MAAVKEVASDAKVATFVSDISDEESVIAMIDECVRQFGRIDFACNNAGMIAGAALTHEMAVDAFERLTNVNTIGVGCRVSRLCATPFLRRHTHYIFFGTKLLHTGHC